MKPTKPHESQRGYFAWYLYDLMVQNKDIVLITCDLGFKQFDAIRDDFPDRFFNVGASEQAGMDIAVGLALSNKIPFIYSITPFLLWRTAESIRIYLNHESIPVKMVGAGRDHDYEKDGFTHDAKDALDLLAMFKNIVSFWPQEKEGIKFSLEEMVGNSKPCFLSLKRK